MPARPPATGHALGSKSCSTHSGFGMATGPASGRSPARLCADATDLKEAPGPLARGFLTFTGTTQEETMVVVMAPEATQADVDAIGDVVRDSAGEAFVSRGISRTIVGLVGEVEQFGSLNLRSGGGLADVLRLAVPYQLISPQDPP